MGTNIELDQISQIGNILKSKGNNVLDELSGKLSASEGVKPVTAPTKAPTPPAQIKAAQNAQTAYGQAAVKIQNPTKAALEAGMTQEEIAAAKKYIKAGEKAQRRAVIDAKVKANNYRAANAEIERSLAAQDAARVVADNKAWERFGQESANSVNNAVRSAAEQADRQAQILSQNKVAAGTDKSLRKFIDETIVRKPDSKLRRLNHYYSLVETKGAAKKGGLAGRISLLKRRIENDQSALATLDKRLAKVKNKKLKAKLKTERFQIKQRIKSNQTSLNNLFAIQQRIAQTAANGTPPLAEAASSSTRNIIDGVTARVVADTVAKPIINKAAEAAKIKEKEHFKKVFDNIDKESQEARTALKERLAKYKAAKAAKNAEKTHFDKVFKEIQERSDAAQVSLKERLAKSKASKAAPKPAAAEGAAKTGFFKRIGSSVAKFFKEGKGKAIWEPIKKNPKTAAAITAALVIIGGTIYAMSGDKNPDETQPRKDEV